MTLEAFTDSTAFRAGQEYERRRIGELIRLRAQTLSDLPGPISRRSIAELLGLAKAIDEAP